MTSAVTTVTPQGGLKIPGDDEYLGSCDVRQARIKTIPGDYNVMTLIETIKEGIIKIPGFQRNYVWSKKQASKLIESAIVGIPIPQIFLYEKSEDELLVIDGQQRLLSLYYFVNEKFPTDNLRLILPTHSKINDLPFTNAEYFNDFKLQLPVLTPDKPNLLNNLKYTDLESKDRSAFDRRPIRTITINQQENNDDAMYEVFTRLNSGTILKPQEVRRCMYDSPFYEMLYEVNTDKDWRELYANGASPDKHMKDVEILLRGLAMLENGDSYHETMVKFLNSYSEYAKSFSDQKIKLLRDMLKSFFEHNKNLSLQTNDSKRSSPMVFESVFVVACETAYSQNTTNAKTIDPVKLIKLKNNPDFQETMQKNTTSTKNVKLRLSISRKILAD